MKHIGQLILIAGGLGMLVLAWGFVTQAAWATYWWPIPDGPLSYTFVASMQAAIAAAMLWIGITQSWHMLVAGAINLFVMLGGTAIYLWSAQDQIALLRQQKPEEPHLAVTSLAIAVTIFALFNLGLLFWARRFRLTDPRPMPLGLRLAFGIFVLALVTVGGALVMQTPNVFPWQLSAPTAALFGWMFLGDAFYFLYALLFPRWGNAATQLWSFLAYDLVLLPPFLRRFSTVEAELRPSLTIYTAILCFSAAVAIYYLLLAPATRIWSQPPRMQQVMK